MLLKLYGLVACCQPAQHKSVNTLGVKQLQTTTRLTMITGMHISSVILRNPWVYLEVSPLKDRRTLMSEFSPKDLFYLGLS